MATCTDFDELALKAVGGGPQNEVQNNLPNAQQELPCHGHACVQCDKCRDWYWTPYTSCCSVRKYYIRRPDATCTGCLAGSYDNRYDFDSCYGGGSYYHFFFACCFFGRHCECDDNRIPL
jgi:hypothetical protein